MWQIDAVNGLQWKLIHETWLTGREGTKPALNIRATEQEATKSEPSVQASEFERPVQEAPSFEATVHAPQSEVVQKIPKTEALVQEAQFSEPPV